MLNRVALVGRLTRDPELRRTGSGKAVTSFNLAVERNFKSDDQEADFINCVCWGKVAENTERYCSKGSMVSVDGRIQTRNYENNQGQKVYVTEVIADSVQFIQTNRNNNTATAAQAPTNSYVPNEPIQQFEDDNYMLEEDDIQF
ncbi:Helix-destabilizing protein [Roseburia hominis]|uniref:single-stranded DNA-binding protein n=1 Tax=Catenibacterium mitsuokai TaxID=100886 RepID=UPI0006C3F2C5|nr:single-stranded DNA-binding protein [Catenibacterium mitsuokai]CUO79555.1 Helix-destabilizing protein [Roseburia hominis]CUO89816.1 Helix-destabilizing protein [Catenibacterium mitsuokai]